VVLVALLLITYHAYLSGRWAARPSKIQHRNTHALDPVLERGEDDSDAEPETSAPTPARQGMGFPGSSQSVSTRTGKPEMNTGSARKLTEGDSRINVNRASLDELQRLPGIGPKLAKGIIDQRQVLPFRHVDDLRKVSGIGPKTLDKIRPLVRVDSPPEADSTQ
jgi:competence ComEA-like helix-hairpin-helix protein